MRSDSQYCLISPCRDEERYVRSTIESVLRQSVLPALWIIVDDGSEDETPKILSEYAKRFVWIHIVRKANRGFRSVGNGVVEAFYAGYDTIDINDFEYICKMDLDLEIPPYYFEIMLKRMKQNPRLGTCSGKPYYVNSKGKLISEKCGDENSVGMIKFYRTKCFQQIGGFVKEVMWDGIDGHRCRMLGWLACSWDDPEIHFIHLRAMGTSYKNWWAGRVRHGYGQYFMGTSPIYMIVSAVYRMTRPPRFIGGVAMLWGYFSSWLARKQQYQDIEFRQFLRKYQWDCLLKGKKRATEKFERISIVSFRKYEININDRE